MQVQGLQNNPKKEWPAIPTKRYFTIGEASQLCDVKPHVLRYWEQEFSQLAPAKRRGNRRYYQQKDLIIIREIYDLLYEKGFTITGARRFFKEKISGSPLSKEAMIETLERAFGLLNC